MAGKDRGAFLMPEVEDEVLVAFEHGDFDHPFIVGFLWNGVDMPPEKTTKNRIIKTPGGHQLRFEDTDGAKKVIVKSAGEHVIEIDDTAQTITLKTKNGEPKFILNNISQSITIKGGGRSILMSNGTILMT